MTGHTTLVSSSKTFSTRGGSQFSLHSQCESRNVSIFALDISAPRTLDLTRPSRLLFLITRTLLIFANSNPSSAFEFQNTVGPSKLKIFKLILITYGDLRSHLRG